jgi:hypothetical protein
MWKVSGDGQHEKEAGKVLNGSGKGVVLCWALGLCIAKMVKLTGRCGSAAGRLDLIIGRAGLGIKKHLSDFPLGRA